MTLRVTARETALTILVRLEREELFADRALSEAFTAGDLDSRDRALTTELVNGVIRWRRRLDWHLDHLLVRRRTDDLTSWIRNTLRLGLYQLKHLDRIPAAAATHQSVSLARRYGHRGTASLVNAVLRSALRNGLREPPFPSVAEDPVVHIGLRYSHPDWMVRRWLRRYGVDETARLCEANNRAPPMTVRIHHLQADVEQVGQSLKEEGIESRPSELVPGCLRLKSPGDITLTKAFRRGWIQVQDESAALSVMLLDPQPGEEVIDLCAGQGGKTSHLADLMGDGGLLLAVDLHPGRLAQLMDNCRRLGIRSVRPVVADGRSLLVQSKVKRLLLDAPCSGLGVLARRVDLRWNKRPDDIGRLAELQLALLRHAVDLIQNGGCLVYSTCTIEDEENEEVVRRLLSERDDIVLEPPTPTVPKETITSREVVRTFPHHHGVDGIFAARLRKTGEQRA
jgi:16S rRNA (cytosine967-C5)-methyltransferase